MLYCHTTVLGYGEGLNPASMFINPTTFCMFVSVPSLLLSGCHLFQELHICFSLIFCTQISPLVFLVLIVLHCHFGALYR